MNIHIFIAHMGIGGAERVCVNLANEFTCQGHEVHIVVLNLKDDINTHLLHPSIKVHSLGVSRLRYSMIGMYRYIKKYKPKFLFVFGNEMTVILNKMKKLHLISVPLVVRVLNNVNISLSKEDRISPIVENYLKKQQKELGNAEHVIAQCKGMEEMLLERNLVKENRVTTVYNPVSSSLIEQTTKIRIPFEKRDPYRIKEIVFIGRIDPQKNLSHLLQAFTILHTKYPNTKLRLIGDGNVTEQMKELAKSLCIEDSVTLEGVIKDMERVYATADVIALSSEYEGMPNCLIEAIGCGIPVVSYDCPLGPKEIIIENENGYLIPYYEIDKLADGLEKAINKIWDENTIQMTAEKFQVATIVKQYISIFERL